MIVAGQIEHTPRLHMDEGLGRNRVRRRKPEHPVADDGGTHMGADTGQRCRTGAVFVKVEHIGPQSVVGDHDVAAATKEEVVGAVGAIHAAGQGQLRVRVGIDAGCRGQLDGPRPSIVILDIAERTLVGHPHARQPQGLVIIGRAGGGANFQRTARQNRRPAIDRIGTQ